jgi:hypothetical protein
MTAALASMMACPRWDKCGAPICPADAARRCRAHLAGERVCFYLTECGKDGGAARLARRLSAPLVEAVAQCHRAITRPTTHETLPRGHAIVRRTIEKAATTGSRIEASERAGARLRNAAP